jgi:hypothetical protein
MNLAKNQISQRDGLKLGLAGLTVSPWGAPFFAKAATEEKMTIAITATRTLLPSPEILMQKLQPCYANARAVEGPDGHRL